MKRLMDLLATAGAARPRRQRHSQAPEPCFATYYDPLSSAPPPTSRSGGPVQATQQPLDEQIPCRCR